MIVMIEETGAQTLTTEERIALVQRDHEALEKRVALIEAMLAAIRLDDDPQGAQSP